MPWGIRPAAAIAALLALAAPASASAFDAHGSVNQVYVTGLSPGAKTTLLDRRGRKLKTQKANPLGGLLFRDVRAGSRYRVRSGAERSAPLTVLSARPAPPTPGFHAQPTRSRGYDHLAPRDGTTPPYHADPPQHVTTVSGLPVP